MRWGVGASYVRVVDDPHPTHPMAVERPPRARYGAWAGGVARATAFRGFERPLTAIPADPFEIEM